MFDLIIILGLLALGYGFGRYAESRHYQSIRKREHELRRVLAIPARFPGASVKVSDTRLVTGSVVVSVDYFKRFLAGLRMITGGRVTSYESLVDRARREAILRMKARAADAGANMVFNIKFETSSIYKSQRQTIGSIEVLAYGTALIPA